MEYTSTLRLKKPEYTDPVDIQDLNDNADIVEGMNARVSNLINELTENPEYAPTAEVVDIRTGYDGTIHETAGDAVRAVGQDLNELREDLEDFIGAEAVNDLEYNTDDSMLYLTANGTRVGNGVQIVSGGGGSGGGSSSVVRLTNLNDSNAMSAAAGSSVILRFNFSSLEDELPTGNGTCKITVNGATKYTASIAQGENAIEIKDLVSEGSNTVRLTVTDVYGVSKSLAYTVSIIALSISSNFDGTAVYDGDITFKFTPVGLVEKTVKFYIDGALDSTMTVSASGKQNTKVFSALSHGSHKLVVYCEATVDGATITSNRLVYDLICIESGETGVVVSCPFEDASVSEGELVEIPFSVYDPSNLTADVTLTIANSGETYATQSRTVDRTQQTWSTRQYPAGTTTFTIACGSVSKTVTLTVAESNIPVEAETEDLTLFLSSGGRSNSEANPAVWTDGETTTTFENVSWVNTGWVADSNGDTALRLSGEARATINMTPFANDARLAGKTIEMEFAIRDVSNRDAVAISCMNGGIGFQATADRFTMSSEQSSVDCRYKDDEKIRVAFTVEPRTEYRLMCVYLNGVLSGAVQYPDNDNFQQPAPVGITLGSDYCSIDVYAIRIYDAALTADQVRDNWIADTADILEKQELYEANNIYDAYGALSFDALADKIPIVTIIGQLPASKGDKQDVVIEYANPFYPELNFTDTCKADVQGTSSQWFPRKNYKLKFSTAHQHYPNMMSAKVFCMKADFAEATGTHNTANANYVHTLFGNTKTPPQEEDALIRTTIFGFPCVIFHKATENDEPVFLGKYNFNYDKSAENVYGFTGAYPLAESWEFGNNTSDACLFHGAVTEQNWSDNFEARYPDEYDNISAFKIMHDWVVSTWQGGATGEALAETYTDIDGGTHTVDNAAYRLAKFKTEFEDHFEKDFCTIYYVYTLLMLMVDQRAKNMFLTTWDGVHWEPWLYDNDTCLGINNEGQLVFDYYHEDIDQLDGANVYNGQTSALWVNFREAFGSDIKALYQSLRSSGKVTYQEIYDWFITNHANKWSASVYNEDSNFKYIEELHTEGSPQYLSQIRGTGKEHLGYFVRNRIDYLDSKFYASDYANDYATLRIYTPETYAGVTPNADITVTPYSNMYAGVRYKANGALLQHRVSKNVPYTFDAPDETFNDTETAVYGAHNISSLGDLSPLYCGSVNVSAATKLKELIVGSSATGYSNGNLTELTVGTNRLLRKVDVTNCPNLTSPLDLSGCQNIEEVYAKGSGITAVNLPQSGYLKKMHLPATITNLTVQNQSNLTELTCDGYTNLTTLRIENCDGLDASLDTILNAATNLSRVRMIGIDATFANANALLRLTDNTTVHGLDENGNNIENAVVTGHAHITMCNADALTTLQAFFPYLTITYDTTSYTVTFQSYDGTTVYTEDIQRGTAAQNPISYGYISVSAVAKPADAHYTYEFYGWDKALNNITANLTVSATYTAVARMYNVSWVNGETTTVESIEYNTPISKPLTDADCPYHDGAEYIWGGWRYETYDDNGDLTDSCDLYSSVVAGRTTATALWYKVAVPSQIKAFEACDWGEIKAVCDAARAGTLTNNNGISCDIDTWWAVHDEKELKLSTREEVIVKIAGFWLEADENGTPIPLHLIMKHGLATARQMNYAAKYQYGYTVNGDEVEKNTGYTVNYSYDAENPQVEIEFTEYTFLTSIVRTIDGVATTWGFSGARSSTPATRLATQFSYEDCNLARTDGAKFTGTVTWNMNDDAGSAITVDATGGSVNFYDTAMTSTSGDYRTLEFAPGSKLIIPMSAAGTVKINARQMWNAGGYFNSDLYNDIEVGGKRRYTDDPCEDAPLVEQFPPIIQKILTPFKLTSNLGGLTKEAVETRVVRMAPPLANELQNSSSHFNQGAYTLERAYSAPVAGSRTKVADGRWPCYTSNASRIITRGKNGAASSTWAASGGRYHTGAFAYVYTDGGVTSYNGAHGQFTVFVGFGI